jgi:hypothetical protein
MKIHLYQVSFIHIYNSYIYIYILYIYIYSVCIYIIVADSTCIANAVEGQRIF